MEQMKDKDQQRMLMDETDYIDIPAFFRSFRRYARKYIVFVLPLIICMIICTTVCLELFSKSYAKKNYVAGGTSMIGVRLSDSFSFDYTFSGLSWDRQSTLQNLNNILNSLSGSGYITQYVRDYMGIKRNEELNGQIYLDATSSANLINIYVVSETPDDAEAIRDAVFTCLPDAVFPALGFIEMDIQEMYTREETSPRAFLVSLASLKAGAAVGAVLGIMGYLGLVFLYTLRRRDVETPREIRKLTDLPCLGRLPALKKRKRFHKPGKTEEWNASLVMTEEYKRTFDSFRRTLAEEIMRRQIKVLLLTGNGRRKGQSAIASELEKAWKSMGKKVILTYLALIDKPMTEEKVRCWLDQNLEKADLILIDGPSYDQSADTLIMADCADAMIMVIREGASQPDELREMFQSLQYADARSLGYVINICRDV